MSVSSGFFNSQNGDRKYSAEQMSALFDALITDGVFANIGTAFEVKILSGTSNDTITVGVGRCWFNSTWLYNDALLPITIEPAEVILDRIDAVIIEINKNEDIRSGQIRMIRGVPSANPENPELTKSNNVYQYPLAYIYRSAGSSTITQASITNMIGTSACPYVTGILEVQTIDKIVAQWEAEFNTWFDQMKSVLDGDVAANLANKVLEIESQLDTLAKDRMLTRQLESSSAIALQDNNGAALMGATVFSAAGETLTIQTGGASDVDEVFKVGDILTTLRHDLNSSWMLCNGNVISRLDYPEFSAIRESSYKGNWIKHLLYGSYDASVSDGSSCFNDIAYGNGVYAAQGLKITNEDRTYRRVVAYTSSLDEGSEWSEFIMKTDSSFSSHIDYVNGYFVIPFLYNKKQHTIYAGTSPNNLSEVLVQNGSVGSTYSGQDFCPTNVIYVNGVYIYTVYMKANSSTGYQYVFYTTDLFGTWKVYEAYDTSSAYYNKMFHANNKLVIIGRDDYETAAIRSTNAPTSSNLTIGSFTTLYDATDEDVKDCVHVNGQYIFLTYNSTTKFSYLLVMDESYSFSNRIDDEPDKLIDKILFYDPDLNSNITFIPNNIIYRDNRYIVSGTQIMANNIYVSTLFYSSNLYGPWTVIQNNFKNISYHINELVEVNGHLTYVGEDSEEQSYENNKTKAMVAVLDESKMSVPELSFNDAYAYIKVKS